MPAAARKVELAIAKAGVQQTARRTRSPASRLGRRPYIQVMDAAAHLGFVTALTGVSAEIYEQVSDVLVAWTLGLAWLTFVVVAHRLFLTVHRRRRLDRGA